MVLLDRAQLRLYKSYTLRSRRDRGSDERSRARGGAAGDGVLTLKLPRTEGVKPREITIDAV
jgi:hypothetical protein